MKIRWKAGDKGKGWVGEDDQLAGGRCEPLQVGWSGGVKGGWMGWCRGGWVVQVDRLHGVLRVVDADGMGWDGMPRCRDAG